MLEMNIPYTPLSSPSLALVAGLIGGGFIFLGIGFASVNQ
jgi:hypothetical protein